MYMCQSIIIFTWVLKANSLAQFSFLPFHLHFWDIWRHVGDWIIFFFPSRYDSSTIFKEGFLQTCLLIISKRKSSISSVQRRMYLKHRWAKWPLRVQAWWQWVDYSFSLLAHKPLHSSVFTCSLCLVPCDTLSLNGSCRLVQSFLIL